MNLWWECPKCGKKVDYSKQMEINFHEDGKADFHLEAGYGVWWCAIDCECGANWETGISGMLERWERKDVVIHYNRGIKYLDDNDPEEAVKWLQSAADREHPEARFNLGVMYKNGRGVTQCSKTAAKLWEGLAEEGYANGQYNIGLMHVEGDGVPQSYEKALEWFHKAAEQGYAAAQCSIGYMYEIAQGLPRDYEKAVEWYGKAAEQDFYLAQYRLGLMYLLGMGVPQDVMKALELFGKAIEQGYEDALDDVDFIYEEAVRVGDEEVAEYVRRNYR